MATTDDAILQAIASLTEEVRDGFKRVEDKQDKQDVRITATEKEIVRVKTVWTGLLMLLGFAAHTFKDWMIGRAS